MTTPADKRSLGELVSSATTDLTALVHEEVALAKAELRHEVKRGVVGGGAGAVAGVLALFAVPVLSIAAAEGIHNLGLGRAWSYLIVGVAFLLLAAVAGLVAKSFLSKIGPPRRTIETAKESAAVLSHAKPRPRAPLGAPRGRPSLEKDAGGRKAVTRSSV